MKKIIMAFAAVGFVALLSSCDTKLCYCYERDSHGTLYSSEVYIDSDLPCSSQSTASRGCIEREELGTINPDDIAK